MHEADDKQAQLDQLRKEVITQKAIFTAAAREQKLNARIMVEKREATLRTDMQVFETILRAKLAEKMEMKWKDADSALLAVQNKAADLIEKAEAALRSDMKIVEKMEARIVYLSIALENTIPYNLTDKAIDRKQVAK